MSEATTPTLHEYACRIEGTDHFMGGFRCEACGEVQLIGGEGYGVEILCDTWDYCPLCGAKVNRPEKEADAR